MVFSSSHLCTLNIGPDLASKLFVVSQIMLEGPPLKGAVCKKSWFLSLVTNSSHTYLLGKLKQLYSVKHHSYTVEVKQEEKTFLTQSGLKMLNILCQIWNVVEVSKSMCLSCKGERASSITKASFYGWQYAKLYIFSIKKLFKAACQRMNGLK